MLVLEMERVEIDHCDRCGGTWLDAHELALIAGDHPEADRLVQAVESGRDGGRTPRRCPQCRRRLREVVVEAGADVVLDRCAHGHGLWCDRGEMGTLIRSFGRGGDRTIAFLAQLYAYEANAIEGRV
jgi:Zn-finger nucleic acid-binding protein